MADEPTELDERELEEQEGEELPEREVMSVITPVGDSLPPPPIAE